MSSGRTRGSAQWDSRARAANPVSGCRRNGELLRCVGGYGGGGQLCPGQPATIPLALCHLGCQLPKSAGHPGEVRGMGKREKKEGVSVKIQRAKELKVSVVGRMDGKKGQEEMKVEGRNRKRKREDDGKLCPAPNREEKQEAVAVTERHSKD